MPTLQSCWLNDMTRIEKKYIQTYTQTYTEVKTITIKNSPFQKLTHDRLWRQVHGKTKEFNSRILQLIAKLFEPFWLITFFSCFPIYIKKKPC